MFNYIQGDVQRERTLFSFLQWEIKNLTIRDRLGTIVAIRMKTRAGNLIESHANTRSDDYGNYRRPIRR